MVQYRALVIALILLLSTTVPEVHSRYMPDRQRNDWMMYPDTLAAYIYELVNKISPRAGQFLLDLSQNTFVSGIRNFLITETAKINLLAEKMVEKVKSLLYSKMPGY